MLQHRSFLAISILPFLRGISLKIYLKRFHRDVRYPNHDSPQANQMATKLRHHAPALLLILVVIACSFPWWFESGGPGYDDLSRLNGPQRVFLAWAFRHGHLPLWNPFSFGGQPFLSAGQSGPLYLPNIVFVLLPILTAFKISYIFHTFLTAIGCYLVSYQITRRRLAGIVSAVSFTTCGFMIGHQIHTQMFDAMSWLPLLFYLLLKVQEERRLRWVLALGTAGALEIYAGHPQITFFALLFLGLTYLVMLLLSATRASLQAGLCLVASGAIAAGLSAAQWLPTLGLVLYSDRQQVPAWYLLRLSLPPQGFLQFFTPFAAGGGYSGLPFTLDGYAHRFTTPIFWELTCYAGITALVLAITGAVSWFRKHPAVPALVVTGVLAACLALGAASPFRDVLIDSPGFDLFRVPARYIGLVDFSIAILAGIGVAAVAQGVGDRRRLPLVLTTVAGGLCTAALVASYFDSVLHIDPLVTTIIPSILALLVPAIAWISYGYTPAVRHPHRFSNRSLWAGLTLTAVVIIDMLTQAIVWTPFIRDPSPSYASQGVVAQFLKGHMTNSNDPLSRIVSMPDAPLAYDEAAAFQIPSLDGYDSLEPQWYAKQLDLTWTAAGLFSEPRSLLDAYNVKYLITANDDLPDWSNQTRGPTTYTHTFAQVPSNALSLYLQLQSSKSVPSTPEPLLSVTLRSGTRTWTELLQGTPNQAFLIPLPENWPRQAPTTVIVRCESWDTSFWLDALSWMTPGEKPQQPFDAHTLLHPEALQRVFVSSTATIWENPTAKASAWVTKTPTDPLSTTTGAVKIRSMEPNQQVWQTNSTVNGELLISQTYDPGWRAYVDGKPSAVDRVGGLYGDMLTGVSVPSGQHQVVLTYQPRSFTAGLRIVELTALALLLLFGRLRWVKHSRHSRARRSQSPTL